MELKIFFRHCLDGIKWFSVHKKTKTPLYLMHSFSRMVHTNHYMARFTTFQAVTTTYFFPFFGILCPSKQSGAALLKWGSNGAVPAL